MKEARRRVRPLSKTESRIAVKMNAYVALYNGASCAGWAYVLLLLLSHLAGGGAPGGVHAVLGEPLKWVQTAALLEVLHAATGLVRANAATTAFQVASRLAIVWPVLHYAADARASQAVVPLVIAWGVTEVVRYYYFFAREVGIDGYLSGWLRYSLFPVLYPLGASSEAYLLWRALPTFKASGMWSITMPNALNFAFDLHNVAIVVLVLYPPGLAFMMSHMAAQRKGFLKRHAPASAKKTS